MSWIKPLLLFSFVSCAIFFALRDLRPNKIAPKSSSCDRQIESMIKFDFEESRINGTICQKLLIKSQDKKKFISSVVLSSMVLRYELKLVEASLLWENLKFNFEEYPSALLESLLVNFEANGGEKAIQEIVDIGSKSDKSNKSLHHLPLNLLKIYFKPYGNIDSHLIWLEEVEKSYVEKFQVNKPSMLFWTHITRAKVLRRMGQNKLSSESLLLAEKASNLKKPDLGFDKLKLYFEQVVQKMCAGFSKEQLRPSLEKIEFFATESGVKSWIEFSNYLNQSIADGKSLDLLAPQMRPFGKGHFVVEGVEFLMINCD